MAVYQCLSCRNIYGSDSRLKGKVKLKKVDPKTHARHLDCDTWRCPHCGAYQDTRDVSPFLGCRGTNQLRQVSEREIEELVDPVKAQLGRLMRGEVPFGR